MNWSRFTNPTHEPVDPELAQEIIDERADRLRDDDVDRQRCEHCGSVKIPPNYFWCPECDCEPQVNPLLAFHAPVAQSQAMQERSRDKLVEAVITVAQEVHEMHKAFTAAAAALINNKSILNRIEQAERNIMSAISDFAAKQKAFNDRQATAIDSVVTSQGGLTADIAELKRLIEELQNSPGTITPEDQALLDDLTAKAEEATNKAESVAAALAALDQQTPPAVPPTPAA
jgi:hypothetical protein